MFLALCAVFVVLALLLLWAGFRTINSQKQFVYQNIEKSENFEYGIVFGSGINPDGVPYDELRARLDQAAYSYNQGKVKKLLLSGDNRALEYNEPTAMKFYLMDTHKLPEAALQEDFGGRSTYETCERAKKVFGIDKALLFSAESHLPRAIYTCRHFEVEAYGLASGVEAENAGRREPLAVIKMYFNLYIKGEKTLLGDPIEF